MYSMKRKRKICHLLLPMIPKKENGNAPIGKSTIRLMISLSVFVMFCLTQGKTVLAQAGIYENYKLVVVEIETMTQVQQLHDIGAESLSDYPQKGSMAYIVPPELMHTLQDLGIQYKVVDENIQDEIDQERDRIEAREPVDPRGPIRKATLAAPASLADISWYEEYRSFAEYVARMQALATDYPNLVSLEIIGYSHEDNPIYSLAVGENSNKPLVLFVGMQHAREWIAGMTTMFLADSLIEDYYLDANVTDLVDNVGFLFIPVSNPDGYRYSYDDQEERLWRKNRRNCGNGNYGADLNRNWDIMWCTGTSVSHDCADDTYCGPSPFSEPETIAIRDYINARPNIEAFIDVHSYSQFLLIPWAYDQSLVPTDQKTLSLWRGEMHDAIFEVHGEEYTYELWYEPSGSADDWNYLTNNRMSFTIELRPEDEPPGFLLPPDQIIPNGEEIYPTIRVIGERVNCTKFIRNRNITSAETVSGCAVVAGPNTNISANVSFIADEYIHLKPGFRVNRGSQFNASIR